MLYLSNTAFAEVAKRSISNGPKLPSKRAMSDGFSLYLSPSYALDRKSLALFLSVASQATTNEAYLSASIFSMVFSFSWMSGEAEYCFRKPYTTVVLSQNNLTHLCSILSPNNLRVWITASYSSR